MESQRPGTGPLARASVAVVMGAAIACGADPRDAAEPPPPSADLSCEGDPDPHCGHPIDRLLVPRLRAAGLAIRDADPDELGRRIAIDLTGQAPSEAERAAWRGQTPAEMFDAFAATPGYLREQRRFWGELFRYDALVQRTEEIAD